ncbi:hypothetical protein [Micromonospora matsumotoense]|uniref:hypothetical protein n=1 Tax=Micromonospora matsumotoense TaxID=121616 RepID=UPI003F4CC594
MLGVIAHTTSFRDGGERLDPLLAGLDDNRRLLAALPAEHLPGFVTGPARRVVLRRCWASSTFCGSTASRKEVRTMSDVLRPLRVPASTRI